MARIIERVDGRLRLEVQIARPVDPLEQVAEERGDVVNIQRGIVLARHDQQVLGQRELPLAEDRAGGREDLLRPANRFVRHVPLAGDRQEKGMNPGSVNGVHGADAGDARSG